MKADFAPVRWWQVISFIRLNFAVVRGHDPWADRVLSRPWALSSLLEYAYMLVAFPGSNTWFIVVSDERAGVLWTIKRAGFLYILTLGLLAQFQHHGIGLQAAHFLDDLRQDCTAAAARMAVVNQPVQRMARQFGGHPLGLATTRLTLSSHPPSVSPLSRIEIRKKKHSEAIAAWRHWRFQAVKHVAGSEGVQVAAGLLDAFDWLESLPRGTYVALHQDDQEIGMAFAHRRKGELNLGLFPSTTYWPGLQTAALITALASYLKSPIRYLTLTQQHADALGASPSFDFERRRERERHYVFWLTEHRLGALQNG